VAALIFGTGYVGAALMARLLDDGEHAVALDNGFATDWPAVQRIAAPAGDRCTLIGGDVRSPSDVRRAFEAAAAQGPISAVYLLAAQASGHPDAAPTEYTEETNLRGARYVLEAALEFNRPPVVFGSSFHVYGSDLAGDVDETRSYGVQRDLSHLSKIYVEKLGELHAARNALSFVPVRLGIVYGIGPVVKRDLRFVTVPHVFCLRALADQPLEVNAGAVAPAGFVHLDDAVSALRIAARSAGRGYAPANAVSQVVAVADVAHLVQQAGAERGLTVQIRSSAAASTVEPAFAARSRLSAEGWRPTRSLAESIGAILDHYRATV